MSKETIIKIKKAISTLKSAAKSSANLLSDLSNGEFEPGENITDEVPLMAHQLQRYQEVLEEKLQYEGKEPEEIQAQKQQEKQDAISRLQDAATDTLNARAKKPVPEAESTEDKESEPEGSGGESNETPEGDQSENPDDLNQEDNQTPVA